MAELIQADWAKVGVKANLMTYEWAEYRKRSKTGEQTVMMFGWSGDNGDPDNFFVPLLGCEAVKGGGNAETSRSGQALRAGADGLQGRSAVDHRRSFDPLRPDPQGSEGLQDG